MSDALRLWAIMDRCTLKARRVIWHAGNAVHEVGGSTIGVEHVLLGLMAPDVPTGLIFASLPQGGAQLRGEAIALLGGASVSETREVPFGEAALRVLTAAEAEANKLEEAKIQSGHLLLAILGSADTPVARLLRASGVTADNVRAHMSEIDEGAEGA
jgi:ATP-dependent Clp protease ATP-binding subunit ClpA